MERKLDHDAGALPLTTPSARMDIYQLIRHVAAAQLAMIQHELPVPVSRKAWDELGDEMSRNEKLPVMTVPARSCFSMRLDVRNMSSHKKRLQMLKVLNPGFDQTFADAMIAVTQQLCQHFRAEWAYSQSDEITLIVAPTDNPAYSHPSGGRRDKLTTESAAMASVLLHRALADRSEAWSQLSVMNSAELPLLTFDCRIAAWPSVRSAFRLVLWRAYDCGVNGVSDAVHSLTAESIVASAVAHPGKKALQAMHTRDKLAFLQRVGKLPLAPHQACGTLLHAQWELRGEQPTRSYRVFEPRECNVINLVKEGAIMADEEQ
jgi:tRNA(His) 5'-end guanylyltransferase